MAIKTHKITVVDVATQEFIERDMNDQELADYNQLLTEYKANNAIKEAEAKAKATNKTALLDKLGITEDEAKLLLS